MTTILDTQATAMDRWGFTEWLNNSRKNDDSYDPPVLDGASNEIISIDGRKLVNFAGIGFLGWQQDAGVLDSFTKAVANYGLVTGGSRITQGVAEPHRAVESLLCQITGKQRALTFGTGLLANVGFVQGMSSRFSFDDQPGVNNADMVMVLDRDSHWSMWKAADRFELGRNLFTFRHNNVTHLRKVLEKLRGRRVVVGFETIYSADGTIAPIGEILDLCEEYGAVSYADDANGFMVYGNGGYRFAKEYEELRRATFIMMSFSKSVGLEGGAIVGPADGIEALEYLSGTSMFTAAIQPPTASAIEYVLRRMIDDPQIMGRYLDRVDSFRARLTQTGCVINETPSYITSITIGSDEIAKHLRKEFIKLGFLVPVFRYPAVKKNRAVIRLLLNARISQEQEESFIDTLVNLKKKYDF